MPEHILFGIAGGAFIGLGSAALLLFNGRIAGVSGIAGTLSQVRSPDWIWRVMFILGIVLGGGLLLLFNPDLVSAPPARPLLLFAAAGLLVGFGARLGSGCTSGHGVCGVARLSPRSIVATITFTAAGAAMVLFVKLVGGI